MVAQRACRVQCDEEVYSGSPLSTLIPYYVSGITIRLTTNQAQPASLLFDAVYISSGYIKMPRSIALDLGEVKLRLTRAGHLWISASEAHAFAIRDGLCWIGRLREALECVTQEALVDDTSQNRPTGNRKRTCMASSGKAMYPFGSQTAGYPTARVVNWPVLIHSLEHSKR